MTAAMPSSAVRFQALSRSKLQFAHVGVIGLSVARVDRLGLAGAVLVIDHEGRLDALGVPAERAFAPYIGREEPGLFDAVQLLLQVTTGESHSHSHTDGRNNSNHKEKSYAHDGFDTSLHLLRHVPRLIPSD